jgi:hypothetical protein
VGESYFTEQVSNMGEVKRVNKYVLLNVSKIFILMRNDINNANNIPLCKKMIDILENGLDNDCLTDALNELGFYESYSDFFVMDNAEASEMVEVKQNHVKIIIDCIEIILGEIKKGNMKNATDLSDVVHWFPESLAMGKNVNMCDFWNIYFKPLVKQNADVKRLKKYFSVWVLI